MFRKFIAFSIALGLVCGGWAMNASARQLINPTTEAMCLLYYKYAKIQPPFEDMANQAPSVKSANEFKKGAAVSAEVKRLSGIFQSVSDVDSIRMPIGMRFSDYDSSLGEYTLSGFGGNSYVGFNCWDKELHLEFDNSPYASSWSLKPEEAEAALKRNQGLRDIEAVATVQLNTTSTSDNADRLLLLSGDVTHILILGAFTHAKLGEFSPDK